EGGDVRAARREGCLPAPRSRKYLLRWSIVIVPPEGSVSGADVRDELPLDLRARRMAARRADREHPRVGADEDVKHEFARRATDGAHPTVDRIIRGAVDVDVRGVEHASCRAVDLPRSLIEGKRRVEAANLGERVDPCKAPPELDRLAPSDLGSRERVAR